MANILFTGATGVIGRATLPHLISQGHTVKALARGTEEAAWLESVGAVPTYVDLLDPQEIPESMEGTDTVIHFATAIPPQNTMTKRDSWLLNDRLRSEATGYLVDAAIDRGVERFIQQSITFFYRDGANAWLDEDATIDPSWDVFDSALDAEQHISRFTISGGSGIALRLGRLYGPGRASAEYVEAVRDRRMPIIGSGQNYVSNIHVADVATAIAASITTPPGVYNVVDDEPVRSSVMVETLAELLDAPRPRHIPKAAARLMIGKATGLLTSSLRVSNARFRNATGWVPQFPSIVDGWRSVTGTHAPELPGVS